jgi:hypothetical protein
MRVPVPDERNEPHEPDDCLIIVQLRKGRGENTHFCGETLPVNSVERIGMNSRQFIGKKLQVRTPHPSATLRHCLLPSARGERQLKHETPEQFFDHELSP